MTRVLLDSSDGQDSWGSIGVSENIIEASWEALVDSLEYAFQPRRPPVARHPSPRPKPGSPHPCPRGREPARADPARQAGPRGARGGAGAGGSALGAAVAGAGAGALRARLRRLAGGRGRGRRLLRHGRPASRRPRARLGPGRRGDHEPVQLRRLGQLPALRGGDAGLLRRRPGDARPRPGGGSRGGRRAHRRAVARGHPRLPGGDAGARAARGGVRPGHARGRLRGARSRATPRACGSARAATSPPSPSTPTSS